MQTHFSRQSIRFLIILLFGLNIAFVVFTQKNKYFSHDFWQHFPTLKQTYLDSQYVNKHPKAWIPDETVNAYAGAAYVKGVSPILIAPDTPPLGRYLIGVSELVFNNPNIFNLFFTVGSLSMLYLVGRQLFQKQLTALLPPLFFSLEPILTNQLRFTPLLDIMQLFFMLCAFYFFNRFLLDKKSKVVLIILAQLFLGCFIATKFYITGITVFAAWFGTLVVFREWRKCLLVLITAPLAVLVLLVSYVRVLADNHSLIKFLGIQKYVLLYHKSQLIYPFSVWDLLLFNRWHVWFGNTPIIGDMQWRLSWPVVTFGTFATGFGLVLRKISLRKTLLPFLLWSICYLLFFSFGQIASRYFIILLPVLYLVTVYACEALYLKYFQKKGR